MALIARYGAGGKPLKKPRGPTPSKIARAAEERGEFLRVHYGGRRRRSYSLNNGPTIDEGYAARAIAGGRLQSAGDGLFDDTPQTWIAKVPPPTDDRVADYFRHMDARLARRDAETKRRLLPFWDSEARNIVNCLLSQRARGVGFVADDEATLAGVERLSRIARRETHKQVLAACAKWLASRA